MIRRSAPIRRSGPKRSTKPIPRSAIKRKPRPKSETLRIYGSPTRREWIKTLPCSACGVVGYSVGAHVLGNGGMSRKAAADTQAPLCRNRGWVVAIIGCHALYDDYPWIFKQQFPDFNAEDAAADTERKWQEEHKQNG